MKTLFGVHAQVSFFLHIYIYRERERKREREIHISIYTSEYIKIWQTNKFARPSGLEGSVITSLSRRWWFFVTMWLSAANRTPHKRIRSPFSTIWRSMTRFCSIFDPRKSDWFLSSFPDSLCGALWNHFWWFVDTFSVRARKILNIKKLLRLQS